MINRNLFVFFAITVFLSSLSIVEAQPDSARAPGLPIIGGDLFFGGEIYGMHLLSEGCALTTSGSIGAEVRIRPFFLGAMTGNCGDEGLPDFHPAGSFSFYSLYAGATIDSYRVEVGEIRADNESWAPNSYDDKDYTSGFIGLSRRWGYVLFFEPEVRLVFPIVATGNYRGDYALGPFDLLKTGPFKRRYGLRDLLFGFSFKFGIGFN